jgi:hypothetical protein
MARGARTVVFSAVLAVLAACGPKSVDRPFGLHGYVRHGLRGQFYTLKKGTDRLPDFRALNTKATVFTPVLDVAPQSSADGFPGLTDRNEWFALDYLTNLSVERAGAYAFRLVSQDGSRLLIDGRSVVDDDGVHPPTGASGSAVLAPGRHQLEVQYFKGPHWRAALQLYCTAPGGREALFPQCGGLTLETPTRLSDNLWWIWMLGLFSAAVGWWLLRGRKSA